MKRAFCFTIIALLGLFASVAMAMGNNWSGAAFGVLLLVAYLSCQSFSPHFQHRGGSHEPPRVTAGEPREGGGGTAGSPWGYGREGKVWVFSLC